MHELVGAKKKARDSNPETRILEKLRRLIADGSLSPGMKLPSERRLAERFGISRGYVRKAIKKLEFYGIVRTLPQRGTLIARIGGKALAGLIASIQNIDEHEDIEALIETRTVLEVHAARMAAQRGGRRDFEEIRKALGEYRQRALAGEGALEEDHLFHLAIARSCGNDVAVSLLSLMTPDIIALNLAYREEDPERFTRTLDEHERIAAAITVRDGEAAARAMALHMEMSRRRRLPDVNFK